MSLEEVGALEADAVEIGAAQIGAAQIETERGPVLVCVGRRPMTVNTAWMSVGRRGAAGRPGSHAARSRT